MSMRWQGAWLLAAALLGAIGLPAEAQSPGCTPKPPLPCPPGAYLHGCPPQETFSTDWNTTSMWLLHHLWRQVQGMTITNEWAPVVFVFTPDGLMPVPLPPEGCCPHKKPETTCPPKPGEDQAARLSGSVLENLHKLEKAQKLCRKAERHCRAGRWDKACEIYDQVKQLCPGSRFEQAATQGLQEVAVRRAAEEAAVGAEEQEISPPKKMRKKKGMAPPGVWLLPPPQSIEPLTVETMDRILVLVEPSRPKLFLHVEEESSGEEQEEPSCDELCMLLRRLFSILSDGSCADVDVSSPRAPRMECEIQLGNCVIRMTVDKKGCRCSKCPATKPDESK